MILICHNPSNRPTERQPAIAAQSAIWNACPPGEVVIAPCWQSLDYALAIRENWQTPGDLIIIEHDMAPTLKMIDELVRCPEPQCAQAYWLSGVSTGRREPVLAAYATSLENTIAYGDRYARRVGIGLVKIAKSSRILLPALVGWEGVCTAVNDSVRFERWHIHYPACVHYHGFKFAQKEVTRA